MTQPSPARVLSALEKTWPAPKQERVGPWTIRSGNGGGQRVSAATAEGPITESDLGLAEHAMGVISQRALFMIREGDIVLDRLLEKKGYDIVDPVSIYLISTSDLAADLPLTQVIPSWPPLAAQLEIWNAAGIGPARVDIMHRCVGAKMSFIGRSNDIPAGTAFVGVDGEVAMVHAIEVDPAIRRQGVGRSLLQASANWCLEQKAKWMCLAVTKANRTANQLYLSLGMCDVAHYHYRRAREDVE